MQHTSFELSLFVFLACLVSLGYIHLGSCLMDRLDYLVSSRAGGPAFAVRWSHEGRRVVRTLVYVVAAVAVWFLNIIDMTVVSGLSREITTNFRALLGLL